jgi:hypothetical protein
MGRIAKRDLVEYEYRDAEYEYRDAEYERKHIPSIGLPSVNAFAPKIPLKAAGVVFPCRPFSFDHLPMTTASGA